MDLDECLHCMEEYTTNDNAPLSVKSDGEHGVGRASKHPVERDYTLVVAQQSHSCNE